MGIERAVKILGQPVDILAKMSYTIMVYFGELINVSRERGDQRLLSLRYQCAVHPFEAKYKKGKKYADIKSVKGDCK